jgi:succinate-acetate transporter protein
MSGYMKLTSHRAIGGFLLALTPLSCILLGWRGSGQLGASDIGAYIFFGGLLMILGSVGEFLLGNTFPTIVFSTFGLSLAEPNFVTSQSSTY